MSGAEVFHPMSTDYRQLFRNACTTVPTVPSSALAPGYAPALDTTVALSTLCPPADYMSDYGTIPSLSPYASNYGATKVFVHGGKLLSIASDASAP